MVFLFLVRDIHADASERLAGVDHVRAIEVPVGNPKAGIGLAGALERGAGVDVANACTVEHGIADARPDRRSGWRGWRRCDGWRGCRCSGRSGFVFDAGGGFGGGACFHLWCVLLFVFVRSL